MNIDYEGKSFPFKKIVNALFKYKWVNLLILLIFWSLGVFYYLSQSPVYGIHATIKIKNVQNIQRDFFGNTIGEASGLETEMDIIRSNLLIEKTLKKINNNVLYYKSDTLFKTQPLYKNSPFKVKNFIVYNPKLYGKKISIKMQSEHTFSLEVKESVKDKIQNFFKNGNGLNIFNKVYKFDKVYVNDDLAFQIEKIATFKKRDYSFLLQSQGSILGSIKKNLKVAPASNDSSVLRLTYKDSCKQRAKDFLNTLIQNYLDYSVKEQTEIDRKRLEFVNYQISSINRKLAESENSLEGFKTKNDISDIQAQIQTVINKEAEVRENLENTKVEYDVIVKLYNEVRHGNYAVISSLADKYPVLATLVQNLEELKRRKETLLVNLTYRHPDVISTQKGIVNLKSSIMDIVKGIKRQVHDKNSALSQDLVYYQKMLAEFPSKEKELGRHERVFKVNDQVYNYLLQKQSELSIEKVSHDANINIIDYAKIAKKLNLKLPLILALSTILGLFSILLHSIVRSKFDVRIKTPEDLTEATDIALYGIIPFIEDKSYNSAYVLEDPSSTASEAIRAIRTNLDYISSSGKSKVVLVTSSIPNEGKTAIAANLASVIGMSEKRVIILSLDLRRPEMHHKFGLSNKIGMSEVLSGKVSLKDAIWEHDMYPNLNIITSGRVSPNPAELLSSSRMKSVIKKLKKEYDYIILDTPPVNYVADAVVLFKYADINLFVVKSDFTEIKHIQELNAMVEKFGLEHSGIILNSVKKKYNKLEQFDYKYLYYEPL